MKRITKIFAASSLIAMLSFGMLSETRAGGSDLDVYVVFSGKDKKDKKALKAALPANLKVKYYNVDLLAVADYSGKQKAIAKFETAKMIVIVKDSPLELLQGSTFAKSLLVMQGARNSVKSENWTVYVVGKGTDLSALGGNLKTLNAASVEDLSDLGLLQSTDAIFVDESAINIYDAVATIVQKISGS